MPKSVTCRRKSAARCRTAKKSCEYVSNKKSRYCRCKCRPKSKRK